AHDRAALDRAGRRGDAGAAPRVHGRRADPHDPRAPDDVGGGGGGGARDSRRGHPLLMATKPSDVLTGNQLLEMYYFARLARDVEERLVILFRQSKVIGGLYRSLGQEGESVATAYALERRDAVLPLIRNMGALMTVGVRPVEVFRQYMAKATSNSRGRDLNIHIVHLPGADNSDEPVIVGPISMLGDSVPVAAGIAIGARMQGKTRVALAWTGRGATS